MKKRNEQGFTIGELLIVITLVLLSLFVGRPYIEQAVRESDQINCSRNLMELTRSTYIYAKDHAGKFPESLQELYDEEYISDKGFLDCPSTEKTGTLADPEYIYTPGLEADMPQEACLIKDSEENHPDGVNSIGTSGSVNWDIKSV